MSKQEIIEQLKNIKEQYLNDTKNEINADVIIEALTDIIHDTEGNDGMDFTKYMMMNTTTALKTLTLGRLRLINLSCVLLH